MLLRIYYLPMNVKISFLFLLTCASMLLAGCTGANKEAPADSWDRVDKIVGQIREPRIPEEVFRLSDYGGSGDGLTDNKPAFERIIEACAEAGGGLILVEAGEYPVHGPIHLQSYMELRLEEGARLIFGTDPADYLPVVLTSWEGTRCYNYSPFIYAKGATDVAISGKGEIDGNASGTWNGWKELQDPDKELIRKMNNEGIPPEERVFGPGHYLRPHLVQFYECTNILVKDVKISDSPFWCLHFVYSDNITVRGLSYEAFNYNNDGIDPESSSNVLIENVSFNNGDDNIAIKAGRDLEGRSLGIASRNIVIRNCRFNGYNAISVGSEMSGGVHDVYVENCSYGGKVIYGFYLKGNRDRGGMVQNIYARNIAFDTVRAAIMIDSDYKNQGTCCPPAFKNIHIEGISANHASDHGIFLKGSPQVHLDSVFISQVEIGSAGLPVEASYTDYINMERVRIGGKSFTWSGGVPEWKKFPSPETGREIWQISSDTAPAVACYFEGQAFTSDENYVVFASRSSGVWRLNRMDLKTGVVRPITPEGRRIMEDDYTVMPGGKRVSYMDGWKLYSTHVEHMEEEVLFDYTGLLPEQPLFSGSFTSDGRYTLVYIRGDKSGGPLTAIYRTNLETGELLEVHRQAGGKITHPLINPEDPKVITYVPGPDTQNDMSLPMELRARTWKVDLNAGTDQQFLTVPYGYRATHESWSHDGERFFFFRKTRPGWRPVAICSQDKNGDDFRVHYESDSIRLGHGTVSRDGRWFVSDSQEPGKNELVLVNLETGRAEVLCWPNSSVDGGHEARAHVHPSFSPKGNYVCYTSDHSGVSQVYLVPLGDLTGKTD
jgi:Tol biopolymer transport system component